MDKDSFLRGMVEAAKTTNNNIKFNEVSKALNKNGFTTNRGTPYSEKNNIGIGKLMSLLFGRTTKSGNLSAAADGANKVVGNDGKHPWAKKK